MTMVTLNILICLSPLPVLLMCLWMQVSCLDRLPKHAFELKRVHLRWGVVFLALFLFTLAWSTYESITTLQDFHFTNRH